MTEKGSKFPQFLAAATASLSAFSTGVTGGWMSPVLVQLQKDGGPLGSPVNMEQSSWMGSLMPVGAIIGSFMSGYLGARWGRKRALLFSVVPHLIGWALVATASHVAQFYVARIIFGIAMTFPFTLLPMYCGEIAETSVRGALGSFLQLFVTIGGLYACSIGPFVSYVVFWILCAIMPVIFFVCFMMMPESPHFLLSKGHRDEAIASLARLRNKSEAGVQKEIDEIQMTLDEALKNQASIWDLFKVKVNFKALMYMCGMISFQQFSGIGFVLAYLHIIFVAAGGSVSSEIAPIIVTVVQLLGSLLTPMIIDKLGRRIILIFSGIGETISLCALGTYFYLKEVQHADDVVEQISWLPVVALVMFIGTYIVGWGAVTWAMMGEMFASNIKAKASSITVFICWFWSFIFTKFSSNIEEASNGKYMLFWIFSGFCIISVFFTIFLLPETKGKSLQEIQDELSGASRSKSVESGTKK